MLYRSYTELYTYIAQESSGPALHCGIPGYMLYSPVFNYAAMKLLNCIHIVLALNGMASLALGKHLVQALPTVYTLHAIPNW